MANFCRKCGTGLIPGQAFCPNCGQAVAAAQPQQYQQTQPQYGQRQPQYQQPSGQKRKKSMVILTVFLAVLLVAEGVIAGLWYPGFFNPQSGADPGSSTKGIPEVNWTPPMLFEINLDYTDKERAEAPVEQMQVSSESPAAQAGDFTVDFGKYNLGDETDTFTVSTLPVHQFKDKNYYLQGYNFSLSSGTDRFVTPVKITLPRDESDGDIVIFITKNPDTGENEEVYYEISDDGKSYILYPTHFSDTDKLVVSAFGKSFADSVKSGDVSRTSTREALSAFYYTSYQKWNRCMTAPVAFSQNDLWSKMMGKYAYLPSADALLTAMDKQIKAEGIESIDFSSPLFEDAKKITDKVDVLSNAKGTADGAKEIISKLSMDEISPGVKDALNKGKGGAGVLGTACAAYSVVTTTIGIINLNDKINQEVANGKFATDKDAVKEHAADYAGIILGIIGTGSSLVGVAAAGTAAAPAAAVVGGVCSLGGLYLYFTAESNKDPYESLSQAEQNYRDYYALTRSKMPYRTFFIGAKDDFDTDSQITLNSVGAVAPLETSLTAEQSKRFTELVNKQMSAVNRTGGFKGVEPRMGITRDFATVCHELFLMLEDTPEKIPDAFTEFFQNYANACFDSLSDSELLAFFREAADKRGFDSTTTALPWKNKTEKEKVKANYTARFVKELWASCSNLFLAFSQEAQHKAQLAVNESIRTEILPLLNTQIEFTVEDTSLNNPKDFSKSLYNAAEVSTGIYTNYEAPDGETYSNNFKYNYDYPMTFRTKDKNGKYQRLDVPVFLPGNDWSEDNTVSGMNVRKGDYIEYYPAQNNFIPYLRDSGGNVVFRCTYYHWLMMGAPTAIAFKDVREKNSQPEIIDFEIPSPGDDGIMRVNIRIGEKSNSDLDVFLGTWEGTENGSNGFLDYTHKHRLEVEHTDDGGISFRMYTKTEYDKEYELDGSYILGGSSKSASNHSYEFNGSTLKILYKNKDSSNSVLQTYVLSGNTITITVPHSYWDVDKEDFVEYTMDYTLTKVSNTVD